MTLNNRYISLGAVAATAMLLSTLAVQAHNGNTRSQNTANLSATSSLLKKNRSCNKVRRINKSTLRSQARQHCLARHGVGRPRGVKNRNYTFTGCTFSRSGNNWRTVARGRISFRCK